MTAALLPFAASAAVIVVAGALLTRFGDQIATRSGLGRFLVGSLLVALATALPELTIDIHAARLGNPDLAVGNLVGSSLFNLFILSIADLLHRAPGGAFERRSIAFALPATASIVVTSLAGMAILGGSSGLGVGRVGLGPLLILCGYLFTLRLVIRDQRSAAADHPLPSPVEDGGEREGGLVRPSLGFLACAAAIFVAGPELARSADTIARETGLGGSFIGTTLVALFTTLPELVTTVSAVRRGAFELAAGNCFGSIAVNAVLLLPVDVAYEGWLLQDVSIVHAFTAFAVVLLTAVVILGQLYRVESRKLFIEPDALLVITLFIAVLVAVYFLRDPSLLP